MREQGVGFFNILSFTLKNLVFTDLHEKDLHPK
jgi:hypothetical protein